MGAALFTSSDLARTIEMSQKLACHRIATLMLGLAILAIFGPIARASEETDAGSNPTTVDIGIYLLDVYDLDLKNSSYVADFYIC